jgi:cell division protein FtsI (penicillin-binding protein 3)
MGEKGLEFESFQTRIYPHGNLYSHILGQINDENYGISGVEKYFNNELIDFNKTKESLKLSLDTNIQYLIKKELKLAMEDFKATGAAGLLIDNKTGEVISLVSLPDYNINIRKNIFDSRYTNKITKGLYELGSVFKTFTVALALEEGLVEPDSNIENISQQIKCSKYVISDIHKFPRNMSVEDILIQSSNIGSIKIARSIGEERYKKFLNELNLLSTPELELEEVSKPRELKWNKCKLETVSYGHGIMTTPLQVAAAYATITNGGYLIKPTLKKNENPINVLLNKQQIISNETSKKMIKILRKVVTDEKGTASLADVYGYNIGGKTGTAQNYEKKDENINTFISIFPVQKPKYVMLIMLNNPKPAPHIIYNYRGTSITNINRNEAGWNSAYISGKILRKIGPILAIKNKEVNDSHVAKKLN